MDFFKCGHRKTPENIKHFGCIAGCRTCHDQRQAKRRAEAEEARERLANLMEVERRAGKSTKQIAEMFGISITTVQRYTLADVPESAKDPFFHERAIKRAAELIHSRPEELLGEMRFPRIVRARWAVMLAMHRRGVPTTSIGKRFSRDHSTVIYGLRQARHELDRSASFRSMFEQVDAA